MLFSFVKEPNFYYNNKLKYQKNLNNNKIMLIRCGIIWVIQLEAINLKFEMDLPYKLLYSISRLSSNRHCCEDIHLFPYLCFKWFGYCCEDMDITLFKRITDNTPGSGASTYWLFLTVFFWFIKSFSTSMSLLSEQ